MSDARRNRRIAGYVKRSLGELLREPPEDPRAQRGRRWKLGSLVTVVVMGLMAGMKRLKEIESLSAELSVAMRKLLAIPRRVPDTTLRDLLVRFDPKALRGLLRASVKAAWRRKALPLTRFPFHVVAMDGKAQVLPAWDDRYTMRQRMDEGRSAFGLLRTITCCLVSTRAKPCLDAIPVPHHTNEMGAFKQAFGELVRHFGRLFTLVTYDAGAASDENGRAVRAAGKHYLFRIKNEAWVMLQTAQLLLGQKSEPLACTEDVLTNRRTVQRKLYLAKVVPIERDRQVWAHAKTFLRIHAETLEDGQIVAQEDRYWVSSLDAEALAPSAWLDLARHHWAVENHCHGTFDKILREDEAPITPMAPMGVLAVTLLRRLSYNLLSFFRSVTQRAEENRLAPWKDVMRSIYVAALTATDDETRHLRTRRDLAACA